MMKPATPMRVALISILYTISFCNNCPHPPRFPTADNFLQYRQVEGGVFGAGGGLALAGFETPITTRWTFALGINQWNCMATYSDSILSLRTEERPILSPYIPSDLYTSNNRLLCFAYTWIPLINYVNPQFTIQQVTFYQNVWGLRSFEEVTEMQTKVEECGDPNDISNVGCLNTVASEYNYCADIMGIIVGVSTNYQLQNDGYNDDGSETPFGECTANCRPYSDPIGFYDPRIDIFKKNKKKKKNSDQDFDLKDFPGFSKSNKFPWANLLEDDDKGFFYRQEHVTPHIGYTVDPISFPRENYESLSKLGSVNVTL